MHKLLVILALALLAPVAQAGHEELHFSQTYLARVADGDVPGTPAVEAAGAVHILEYIRFQHNGTTTVTVGTPESLSCTCGFSPGEGTITVGPENAAGEYVVTVRNSVGTGNAIVVPLSLLDAYRSSAMVKVYLPEGLAANAPVDASVVPGVFDARAIHAFEGTSGSPLPGDFWLTITPAVTTAQPAAPTGDGFGFLELAMGLALGILVWFWLVQKGLVQARSRKQVVQKAIHEEVAAAESKDLLATRKRVLMAGLKELEMAKMQKEVEDGTYDKLKAELKKEAVTAMRALEAHESS